MKFTTLSLIAGTEVCNARCPFCISRMTPLLGVSKRKQEVDWRNFHKAARLAQKGGADTVLITGKGEPTLFPEQISEYLEQLKEYEFPFIEIQSNGLLFVEREEAYRSYLSQWYELGLTTIAVSMVHYDSARNREIYTPHRPSYPELSEIIGRIHAQHIGVRLACVLVHGYIDSGERMAELVKFARAQGVEQLSGRPVNMPGDSRDQEAAEWVRGHRLTEEDVKSIRAFVDEEGTLLQRLPHGGEVYDVWGQNLCVTNSLTHGMSSDGEIRQLIFFPNGNVTYDWQFEGARLLRGRYDKGGANAHQSGNEGSIHLLPPRSAGGNR